MPRFATRAALVAKRIVLPFRLLDDALAEVPELPFGADREDEVAVGRLEHLVRHDLVVPPKRTARVPTPGTPGWLGSIATVEEKRSTSTWSPRPDFSRGERRQHPPRPGCIPR
jgi:hypothetical protein